MSTILEGTWVIELHLGPRMGVYGATLYKLGGIGLLCQLIGVVQEHVYHPGRLVSVWRGAGIGLYIVCILEYELHLEPETTFCKGGGGV